MNQQVSELILTVFYSECVRHLPRMLSKIFFALVKNFVIILIYQLVHVNYRHSSTTDGIILFTDGAPNEGITDAKKLVSAYKEKMRIKRIFRSIPISAMRLGIERTKFLAEVSSLY